MRTHRSHSRTTTDEYHFCLGVFGKEQENAVKSLTGREEIRIKILNRLNELMKKETGNEMIQDVLFTKYLYQ